MKRKNKYTKELLIEYVAESKSWAQVCRRFNIKPAGGTQTYIKKVCIDFGINFSHFTGQGWNKGRVDFKRKDAMQYCKKDFNYGSDKLRKKLIRDGYKEAKCESCGVSEWLGEPVVLELDHIDGDHYNNEFTNLKIMCPNCHALKTRKQRALNSRRKK